MSASAVGGGQVGFCFGSGDQACRGSFLERVRGGSAGGESRVGELDVCWRERVLEDAGAVRERAMESFGRGRLVVRHCGRVQAGRVAKRKNERERGALGLFLSSKEAAAPLECRAGR